MGSFCAHLRSRAELVVKLRQASHTTIDPMLLWNVRPQGHIHDKVARMSRGSQHALSLAGLVNGTEIAGRRLEVGYQSRLKPDYWNRVEEYFREGFVQLHCVAVPSCALQKKSLGKLKRHINRIFASDEKLIVCTKLEQGANGNT